MRVEKKTASRMSPAIVLIAEQASDEYDLACADDLLMFILGNMLWLTRECLLKIAEMIWLRRPIYKR